MANCRAKTARSLSLTFFDPTPGIEISFCSPVFVALMLTGARPIALSLSATWAGVSASSLPVLSAPLRSRTLYAYVAVATVVASQPRPQSRSKSSAWWHFSSAAW